MQIGDTNEYGRVVASIENRYAVERFGIRNFGTDYAEFDADGPTEWLTTKSFAKARRIWQRWIKEPTCGTAVMYRVRYYCDMHGEQFQAEVGWESYKQHARLDDARRTTRNPCKKLKLDT